MLEHFLSRQILKVCFSLLTILWSSSLLASQIQEPSKFQARLNERPGQQVKIKVSRYNTHTDRVTIDVVFIGINNSPLEVHSICWQDRNGCNGNDLSGKWDFEYWVTIPCGAVNMTVVADSRRRDNGKWTFQAGDVHTWAVNPLPDAVGVVPEIVYACGDDPFPRIRPKKFVETTNPDIAIPDDRMQYWYDNAQDATGGINNEGQNWLFKSTTEGFSPSYHQPYIDFHTQNNTRQLLVRARQENINGCPGDVSDIAAVTFVRIPNVDEKFVSGFTPRKYILPDPYIPDCPGFECRVPETYYDLPRASQLDDNVFAPTGEGFQIDFDEITWIHINEDNGNPDGTNCMTPIPFKNDLTGEQGTKWRVCRSHLMVDSVNSACRKYRGTYEYTATVFNPTLDQTSKVHCEGTLDIEVCPDDIGIADLTKLLQDTYNALKEGYFSRIPVALEPTVACQHLHDLYDPVFAMYDNIGIVSDPGGDSYPVLPISYAEFLTQYPSFNPALDYFLQAGAINLKSTDANGKETLITGVGQLLAADPYAINFSSGKNPDDYHTLLRFTPSNGSKQDPSLQTSATQLITLVFPNPSAGAFSIRCPYAGKFNVILADLEGRTVHSSIAEGEVLNIEVFGKELEGTFILTVKDTETGKFSTHKITFDQ